jgi:S-DNA-T family DNA segregation ATPase FtsK/SpoIIIE
MTQDLYDRAVQLLLTERRASTSLIQRRLGIGYNDAARLMERMQANGIVSAPDIVGRREIRAQAGEK